MNTVKIYGTEEEEVVSYGFEQDSAHKLEEIEIYYWFLQTFGDSTITEIIKVIIIAFTQSITTLESQSIYNLNFNYVLLGRPYLLFLV